MIDLLLLQAMRLKGRLDAEAAAACGAIEVSEAQARLDELVAVGHAKRAGTAVRITPEGRERLAALLEEERATLDRAALQRCYDRFTEVNGELKAIITAWQMKDAQTPNDHTDPEYDRGVLARLTELHGRFAPLLGEIVAAVPRLKPYAGRFERAITRIQEGDHSFVARPIADSYHTVWFELHEELIGLLGLSRAEEAAAGRAV